MRNGEKWGWGEWPQSGSQMLGQPASQLLRCVSLVLLKLAVERLAIEPEDLSGSRAVALGLAQHLVDVLPFQLAQRHRVLGRTRQNAGPGSGLADSGGQIRRLYA